LSDAHADLMSAIRTTQNSNQVLVQDRERLLNVDEKVFLLGMKEKLT